MSSSRDPRPHAINARGTRAHWESDQWDDHPAGVEASPFGAGLGYISVKGSSTTASTDQNVARGLAAAAGQNAGLTPAQIAAAMDHAAALTVAGTDSATAATTAVATQAGHLTFLQRLLRFIAHPIKTTQAALHAQSTMHGMLSRHSHMHGYPPGLTPAGVTGKGWYEDQYDALDWSR